MRAVDIADTVLTAIALAISLDSVQERVSPAGITVHPWLSVTESVGLPPKKAVSMSTIQKTNCVSGS
jgi:hypothetical protein